MAEAPDQVQNIVVNFTMADPEGTAPIRVVTHHRRACNDLQRAVWWRDSYMEGAREERWFVAVFSGFFVWNLVLVGLGLGSGSAALVVIGLLFGGLSGFWAWTAWRRSRDEAASAAKWEAERIEAELRRVGKPRVNGFEFDRVVAVSIDGRPVAEDGVLVEHEVKP